MSRRVSLPGADELFRTTGGMALQPSSPRREAKVPGPAGESGTAAAAHDTKDGGERTGEGPEHGAGGAESAAREHRPRGREEEPGRDVAGGTRRSTEAASASVPQARQPGAGGRPAPQGQAGRRSRAAARRPSGRERHDEKITVYVSAEELMDLEHARLVLRGEHGLAVDRGRIVREAVAVVLADLESRGDASILVRRLRGR
ncbi:hypothetical protein AB0J21_24440 [Streptomyces sp. NPDC049954]|uniref:hypothetical protein n=1 Tax=Streptomyces sp. NPDC049954 TaxID=3155779 RepID=UPI003423CE10